MSSAPGKSAQIIPIRRPASKPAQQQQRPDTKGAANDPWFSQVQRAIAQSNKWGAA
jgi:hypothetical protein